MENHCLKVLIIDLEYPRHEINEPINIDTILNSFDEFVYRNVTFDVWYRTMGDKNSRDTNEYDIFLISTKICSFYVLEELLAKLSGKSIIIGGMLATFAFETILKKFSNVILSMGECECNLNSIMRFFIEKNDIDYVKGRLISYKISGVSFVDDNQKIYFSPIVPCDLSLIKKPMEHRALKETLQKNGLIRVEGSRGCPWNQCSFCCVDWRYGCGKWREFPINHTVEEIKELTQNGANIIYFTDEDFVGNSQHFFTLFGEIKRLRDEKVIGLDVSFWGSTSVYTLSKFGQKGLSEFLALSAECNIKVLFIGVESGCNEQLKRYSKGVTKKKNMEILTALQDSGIHVDVGFIMFDSDTNLYELRENLEFCVSTGLNRTISRLAKPIRIIPHTKMACYYKRANLLTGPLDENELIYPYRFRDQKVQVLYDSLNYIHTIVLDKVNELQSVVRMKNKYDNMDYMEDLVNQRNYELEFIKKFVDNFLENDMDYITLGELISQAINATIK